MAGGRLRVRRTDCRTGWQVIDGRGRVIATYRRRESAVSHVREEGSV